MISIPDRPAIRERAAPVGGGNPSAGVAVPAGEGRIGALHLGVTGAMLAAAAAGIDFESGAAVMLSCAAILLLGLPHGALDMVALLRAPSRVRAISTYLALAGAMAALWWVMPGAALLLFFAVAIGHFGEDWPGPGLIAHGGALALLAAPLLFHRAKIDALFTIIAGPGAIPPLANSLLLVAPVAIAAGLTGCALLWSAGRRMLAASSAAALAGMVLLPPLVGFALSFGLFHSPRQFARGLAELGGKAGPGGRAWRGPVMAASAASLLLVIMIAWLGAAEVSLPALSAGVLRGTFVVLSVLTVPHMMMPLVLRMAGRNVADRGVAERGAAERRA
jgi:Brp/Blh family beta-carotene 15,15'-monooxygenase